MPNSKPIRVVGLIALILCLAVVQVNSQCPSATGAPLCTACVPNLLLPPNDCTDCVCAACADLEDFRRVEPNFETCNYCPGLFCEACSSPAVCSNWDEPNCNDLSTAPGVMPVVILRTNLRGTECFDCIANCDFCYAFEKCERCSTGFGTDGVGGCASCNVVGCQRCVVTPAVDATVCLECENPNERPMLDGSACVPCTVPGCSACSAGNQCMACESSGGMMYAPNVLLNSCILCNIAGCSICNLPNTCELCSGGNFPLMPAQTSCVSCPVTVGTCRFCVDNGMGTNVCAICADTGASIPNRVNSAGTACYECNIPNCQFCSANGVCEQCMEANERPSLNGAACVTCNVAGCSNCDSTNVCSACTDPNFKPTIDGSQCIQCMLPLCLSCSTANMCSLYNFALCASPTVPNLEATNCFNCASITGCQFCDNIGGSPACEGCTGNLFLAADGSSCTACPADCQTCSATNVCMTCLASNALPNTAGSMCFTCTIPNCMNCNAIETCSACMGNRFLLPGGSGCAPCPTGCASCSAPNVCQTCSNSMYRPNTAGDACVPCNIVGCATCDTMNICSGCDGNGVLVMSGMMCAQCQSFCAQCSAPNVCIRCNSATQRPNFMGNQCFNCPTGCQFCNADNSCVACEGNRPLAANGMSCGTCFDGCASCSAPGICETCEVSTYRPSLLGTTCVPCDIPGCSNCDTAGVCSKCQDNDLLAVGGLSCGNCPDFCSVCSAPGLCQTCLNIYEKPNTASTQCFLCNIPNCLQCNAANVCAACAVGFSPSYGGSKCVSPGGCPSYSYCATCDSLGACTQCLAPNQKPNVAGNSCFQCTLSHCERCSAFQVCERCQVGYSVAGGFCVQQTGCPSWCQSCDLSGACIQCATPGYLPNILGNACFPCVLNGCERCSAQNYCEQCGTGFSPSGGSCIGASVCPSYCQTCDSTGACIQCHDPTQLPNVGGSACYLCTNPQCMRCSSPNFCQRCNAGYAPSSGNCVPSAVCPSFCANCDATGACTACVDPARKPNVAGTACYPCTVNFCERCSGNQYCERCINGYTGSNGVCSAPITCPIYCSNCDVTGACTQCRDPYQRPNLAGTSCVSCYLNYCERCDVPNVCAQCASGYRVQGGICLVAVTCPSYCAQCGPHGGCTTCADPSYRPNYDGSACYQCQLPYCDKCSATQTCSHCSTGYQLSSSGSCIHQSSCPTGCASCDSAGKCLQCNQPNYYKPNYAGTACYPCSIPYCQYCQHGGVCEKCQSGYEPVSGGSVCRSTSAPVPSNCKVPDCDVCVATSQDTCDVCRTGYRVMNAGAACLRCQSWCKTCVTSYKCSECLADTPSRRVLPNPSGTYCVQCNVSNCQACYSRNRCAECQDINGSPAKPNSSGSSCVACNIPGCRNCNSANVCSRCEAIYTLHHNRCL